MTSSKMTGPTSGAWRRVPADRPVRAVLVGCGGMSAEWLRAAAQVEGLEVVGLVDLNEDAARARQAEFGLVQAQTGTDLSRVLADTSPDLIFDCTVPEAHFQTALTAFEQGIGVLGEKPLADNMAHARQMIQAGQSSAQFHAVIQNRRFDPNIRRVERFVRSGRLGELTTLNADFYVGAHFGGFRDAMKHVLLLDMAIHTFDAARLISGQDPVSVYCHEWNPKGSWYAHGANAVAIFEMTNGVVFTYRGSWAAEGARTTWESDWRVVGTAGSVVWDGGDHPTSSLVRETTGLLSDFTEAELPPVDPQDRVGGHRGLIEEAVSSLRSGQPAETAAVDNIRSLAMVFAAIESAESGKKVPVN